MLINIITLFPNMFVDVFNTSILGRGIKRRLWDFKLYNLRDFGDGDRKNVDDDVYGGGVGRLIKPDVLERSLSCIINDMKIKNFDDENDIFYMSPRGTRLNQYYVEHILKKNSITIICGRYEGIDSRIIEKHNIKEISIGDFILTGGEIPAMALVDSVTRLIPGVVQNDEFSKEESFENFLLEYDQFTKPLDFCGKKVPDVMISGNHVDISNYRRLQSINITRNRRPDLWAKFVANKFIDDNLE